MLGILVIFGFAVTACVSDAQLTPLSTPAPIRCGETPLNIFTCLDNPRVFKSLRKCASVSECERMTCTFRKEDWLDGDKVNRAKLVSHFEQYAKDNPEWAIAVQQVKSACLGADLPAQGVYVNCPAYDVTMCSLMQFIKHAQPSQWSTSPECTYPRQFAASCPVCPSDCFAPLVPYGSCHACILLPRSP